MKSLPDALVLVCRDLVRAQAGADLSPAVVFGGLRASLVVESRLRARGAMVFVGGGPSTIRLDLRVSRRQLLAQR